MANNQDRTKQQISQDITRYFLQFTKGCGSINICHNPYCISNPTVAEKYQNQPKENLVREAFQLVLGSSTRSFCRSLEFLDGPQFLQLIEQCRATNDFTLLIRKIGSVFSNAASLNISFLAEDNDPNSVFGVDLPSLKHFFKQVESLENQRISDALANALTGLVANLKYEARRCDSIASIRQFIVLLHVPFLALQQFHKPLLAPLAAAISELPSSSKHRLQQWFERLSPETFQALLNDLQSAITLKILDEIPKVSIFNPPIQLQTDPQIVPVVKMIKILYEVNEKRHFVKFNEFYNDLISEYIHPGVDFLNFKSSHGFSFCNYSFILNPSIKSHILRQDSLIHMRQQRTEALSQLLSGSFSLPALIIRVRRQNLLRDSIFELSKYSPEDLKKELRVYFDGEEAIDEGGVQKEWFQLIVKEIFDQKYGKFIYHEETKQWWFNNTPFTDSQDLQEFTLIGMILGLAIYNGVILDLHFPNVVYKKLMGGIPDVEDLKVVFPSLAAGFETLLKIDEDVEEIYGHTFEITVSDAFGPRKVNLKENGSSIPLTNENREEYVSLYTKYLLEDSISQPFEAFLKGFKMVCDFQVLQTLFRWEELELLICGEPQLDFDALEKNTIYDNGFHPNHPTIKAFWEVVHAMSPEDKKRLLAFTTGSDRAPIGGLGNLNFVIARHGSDSDRLPSAHTCFNHLLLPEYKSKEKLKERLMTALNLSTEGFGML